ncbi:MAG: hypothetical protein MK209_04215 [Planctomycetes bacterium]|nr:hypothetical protein [Planctomycetota bacterium]
MLVQRVSWVEGAALATVVGVVLWAGGDVVRASYHGYLHATIGEAVRAEGLQPENPYHAGTPLRYYTLYPWLGTWLGAWGLGTMAAFAWLQVFSALLFAPALDALGRAVGLAWTNRRIAFWLTVVGFNAVGWVGWWWNPPSDTAVPVFALESMTFASSAWGWDARLQAFLPKFLNVSSFALALPAVLWALAAGWRARFEGASAWKILLPAAVALAINPLAGGFAGLILLFWGAPRLIQGNGVERLAWIGAGAGAILIALPFLLPAFESAPQGPSLTGSVRFEHDGVLNVLGPLWLLLPWAIAGQLKVRNRGRATAWVVAAGLALGIAAFVQLPWGNEYKLVRLAGLLLAISAAACFGPSSKWRCLAVVLIFFAAPTTALVVRTYLDWGQNGVTPALTQSGGEWQVREAVADKALPTRMHAALLQEERAAVLWMNPAHPGIKAARGLVQGNVLAPALGHALFVDSPHIHNDGYEDLAYRLAWTVGTENLNRVFGAVRGGQIMEVLRNVEIPGLWQGVSLDLARAGLRLARQHLPGRSFLVLTQANFPFVEEALQAEGARVLLSDSGLSLWRLEPWSAESES